MRRRNEQRGSAIVEFALTGIPLIFIWMGIFWMSFGMWQFHTLQYASKMANAYVAVHGASYVAAAGSAIQVKNVATVLANNAVGIVPSSVTLTLTAGAQTPYSCRLDTCKSDNTTWPPTAANAIGTNIQIKAAFTFLSAFGMWTPTQGSTSFANSYNLAGYSEQQILF
jgi:Flp pilus assembly protein TadG